MKKTYTLMTVSGCVLASVITADQDDAVSLAQSFASGLGEPVHIQCEVGRKCERIGTAKGAR